MKLWGGMSSPSLNPKSSVSGLAFGQIRPFAFYYKGYHNGETIQSISS